MTIALSKIREDFPIFNRKINGNSITYLDSASTTQKPKRVIDAICNFYSSHNANIHRGMYSLSIESTDIYDRAKVLVAGLINADEKEIVFTSGTTDGLNLLASTLPQLCKGRNEIVLTEMEHHANLLPWQHLKEKGFVLKFIPLKEDFTLDYEEARKLITDKTAIVSVVHISNALGTVNDVSLLSEIAHEHGAFFVVDAAQSVPHRKVDVKDIGCDFLVFSGHKMYGPTGVGVLYGRKELLDKMTPYKFGGDMIEYVTYEDVGYAEAPQKFEAGTPPIAQVAGLAEAVKFLQSLGLDAIHSHENELTQYALKHLKDMDYVKLYYPPEGAGIISLSVKGVHSHDLASLLNDYNICVRAGHHCAMPLMGKLGISETLRLSMGVYTTREDIDGFVKALKKVYKVFHG